MPPSLGSPVMFEYLGIVCKIEPWSPLWNLGRKSGHKNELNLSEDLFLFFGLHLNLGRRTD